MKRRWGLRESVYRTKITGARAADDDCLGLGGRSPQQERVAVVGVGGVVVVVDDGVEESKIVVAWL